MQKDLKEARKEITGARKEITGVRKEITGIRQDMKEIKSILMKFAAPQNDIPHGQIIHKPFYLKKEAK